MPLVIFIDETSHLGGIETNLITLTSFLPATGWRAEVVALGAGPLIQQLMAKGVVVRPMPVLPFLSTSVYLGYRFKIPNPIAILVNAFLGTIWILRLWRFLHTLPAGTVVHTLSLWAHVFGGLAGRFAGLRVVWHFQDIVRPNSGFGLYRLMVIILANLLPDRIICVSQLVADQFPLRLRSRKAIVLPYAIDVDRFAPNGEAPATLRSQCLIGTAARLTPWKGLELVIQTAALLRQHGYVFTWHIAGDESLGVSGYRAHLQNQIDERDLRDYVKLIGWTGDMPAFYQSLDILVHAPVESEAFGLVVIEALASGLVVVASTNVGATHEVENSQITTVPPHDAEALATAIAQHLSRPLSLAERLARAAQYSVTALTPLDHVQRLVKIYASLSLARVRL